MKRAIQVCLRCGKEYQPTGYNQKYCVECKNSEHAARVAERHILHYEEDNKICRSWAIAHPEQVKANKRRYGEKMKGKPRAWDLAHPGANAVRSAAWKLTHPKARMIWAAEHPTEQRKQRLKSDQKRCALGFVPLNQPFPGCEGHHLDKDHVAYVPKPLHKSVPHNIWTGHNMEQINALARAWLEEQRSVI